MQPSSAEQPKLHASPPTWQLLLFSPLLPQDGMVEATMAKRNPAAQRSQVLLFIRSTSGEKYGNSLSGAGGKFLAICREKGRTRRTFPLNDGLEGGQT
jgi:hypothetical protein